MPAWRGRVWSDTDLGCGIVGPSGRACWLSSEHVGHEHESADLVRWFDSVTPRRSEVTVFLPGDGP